VALAATSVWWYVARSSGLVAWGLASASVLWGLFLSTRVLGNRPRANWLLDLHRFLGGLTVAFIAVHLVGLMLDPFVNFGFSQVLIPFASTWNPLAVAWGVVAMYLLVAVEVSSLMRRRLPKRWWRSIHMAGYGVFVLGTIHLLTAGTDRHSPMLLWTVAITTGAVASMTLYRIMSPQKATRVPKGTIRPRQPIG
jgi:DMSO/TMAO reductase YedYZ heme-binding membrane subunit